MSCKIKEYADELQTTARNLATAGKVFLQLMNLQTPVVKDLQILD